MSDIDNQDLCPQCGHLTDLEKPCVRCGFDLERAEPAPRRRLPWPGIGAVVLLLVGGWWWWRPVEFPLDALVPTAEASESSELSEPCAGSDRCIVAYVTPWCPACRQSGDVIHAIQERYEDRDDVRVVVVVGQDAKSKLEKMAESYGEDGWLDPDGKVWDALSPRVVPTWYVLDGHGKVIEKVAGTHLPFTVHLKKLGMVDY